MSRRRAVTKWLAHLRSIAARSLRSRRVRVLLWLVLLAQCAAVAWKLAPWMTPDSTSYLELADNLSHGFYGEVLDGRAQPDVLRPPGYPLILWFLLHVLHLPGAIVIALQLGAYLLALYLIERFLSRLDLPANLFLAVAAAYPFAAVYSAGLMTESWAMLGYTAVALLVARGRLGTSGSLLCGAAAGTLGLLRTDLLPVPILAAAILALRAWRDDPRLPSSYRTPLLLLAAAGLLLGPYAAWNYANFGKLSPAPMAAAAGSSLYSAYWQERLPNETLNDFYSGRITPPLVSSGYVAEIGRLNSSFGAPPLTSPANPVNYPDNVTRIRANVVFGEAAAAHVASEPLLYARHVLKNVWYLWNMSQYPGIPGFARMPLQVISGLVTLLGLSCALLLLLGRLDSRLPRSLSLFLIYPFAVHLPLHLEARYTAVARPLLLLFAALMVMLLVLRNQSGISDGPFDKLRCFLLGHRRSRLHAYAAPDRAWISRCKHCGLKLVRVRHRRWIPLPADPA